VISRFLPELQRDLGLVYQPENWDAVRLATWLCRNLPEPSLTHASKQAFVAAWLTDLLRRDGFTLARANLQKFLIRNLLEARIRTCASRPWQGVSANAVWRRCGGAGRGDRSLRLRVSRPSLCT
jgi:hypothetical protein